MAHTFKRIISAFGLFSILWFALVYATPVLEQKPSGAVNDFAGLLSQPRNELLSRLSSGLLARTGVSLVLVTTKDLNGSDISDVATRLVEKWGTGSKEKDEGILVLFSVDDRWVRIEVGYGSEGYLTDAVSSTIIREVTPLLSQNDWDNGLGLIMVRCAERVAKNYGLTLADISNEIEAPAQVAPAKLSPVAIIMLLLVAGFLLGTPMGRSALPWILLMLLSSSSSGRGGGGFGGGYSGRSFGGFGGGMSGGGGASGRF